MATQVIKARYMNGVLEPLDKLFIEEGAEVVLTVSEIEPEGSAKG